MKTANDGDYVAVEKTQMIVDEDISTSMKKTTSKNRRKRGDFDDSVWKITSIIHGTVWGISSTFFILAVFGIVPLIYAFYIEHFISNLNYLIYISTVVILSIDSA